MTRERVTPQRRPEDAAPELPSGFDARGDRQWPSTAGGGRPDATTAARRRPSRPRSGSTTRAPRVPFAVLLLGLLVGGLALLLLLNTASAANELSRHELASQDAGVAAQVQQLQNDVAASAAPSNLAKAADSLGMVPAGNPAFLVVGADGTVIVRGSAAPASQIPVAVPAATAAKKPAATAAKKPAATAAKKPAATAAKKPVATAAKKPVAKTVKKPVAAPTSRSPRPSASATPGGNR